MKNNRGFTTAEILITIGIVAAIILIAMLAFSNQIEIIKESVDKASIRCAYNTVLNYYLLDTKGQPTDASDPYREVTVETNSKGHLIYSIKVKPVQKIYGWQSDDYVLTGNNVTQDMGSFYRAHSVTSGCYFYIAYDSVSDSTVFTYVCE